MEHFIANSLMPFLEVIVSMAVTAGLGYGVKYLKAKTGIEIQANQVAFIQNAAMQVVHKAEARAERKMIEKAGEWKHNEATTRLLEMVPDISHEQAKHYVDMAVSMVKGIGKAGNQ